MHKMWQHNFFAFKRMQSWIQEGGIWACNNYLYNTKLQSTQIVLSIRNKQKQNRNRKSFTPVSPLREQRRGRPQETTRPSKPHPRHEAKSNQEGGQNTVPVQKSKKSVQKTIRDLRRKKMFLAQNERMLRKKRNGCEKEESSKQQEQHIKRSDGRQQF